MHKSMTFEVIGEQKLHCQGCEQRVDRLLRTLQGVSQVRAQASDQRIEVQFDPGALEASAVVDCLKNAGYETRIVE